MSNEAIPLSLVNDYVNRKYNYLRLCLYNLILYHSFLESYYVEYKQYLKRVETEFQIIHTITKDEIKIIVLPSFIQKGEIKKKKDGVLYIIGSETARKYRLCVALCKRLYTYAKEVKEYIEYIERTIISLSNNITNFKFFYKLLIVVCLEKEESHEMKRMEKSFQNIATKKAAKKLY